VRLTEEEIRIATWLGQTRNKTNRNANVQDRQIGPQSAFETDIEGVCGELALCKMLNIYPDLEVKPQSHSYDCTFNTLRIDVKTSKYKTARLLVDINKRSSDCDIFVLMVGEKGEYECAGWCYSWAIVNSSCIMDVGHGETFGLNQEDLFPLEHLKEICDYTVED
jgi:hypothetical protein